MPDFHSAFSRCECNSTCSCADAHAVGCAGSVNDRFLYGDWDVAMPLALAKYAALASRGPFFGHAGGRGGDAVLAASWSETFLCQLLVARNVTVGLSAAALVRVRATGDVHVADVLDKRVPPFGCAYAGLRLLDRREGLVALGDARGLQHFPPGTPDADLPRWSGGCLAWNGARYPGGRLEGRRLVDRRDRRAAAPWQEGVGS